VGPALLNVFHEDSHRAGHGSEVHGVLDGRFKKSEDAQVKSGLQKSYKILRTLDDGGEWNLLILREYASLAAFESNVEKADALLQQTEAPTRFSEGIRGLSVRYVCHRHEGAC